MLGPLLYNLYLDTMQHTTKRLLEGVQYVDETFVLHTDKDLRSAKKKQIESNIGGRNRYFERRLLNINPQKNYISKLTAKESRIKLLKYQPGKKGT